MTEPRVEPALAPGGLVFVLYDAADVELERHAATSLGPGDPDLYTAHVAAGHARAVVERGGMVRVFDGDTGEIVAALGTA